MIQTLYRHTGVFKSTQIYVNTDGLCEQYECLLYVVRRVAHVARNLVLMHEPNLYFELYGHPASSTTGCETWETTQITSISFLNISFFTPE